jgi:hypothetical protein
MIERILRTFSRVEHLCFWHTPNPIVVEALPPTPSLTRLDVLFQRKTQLSDLRLPFSSLPSLRTLHIQNAACALSALEPLTDLTELGLQGNCALLQPVSLPSLRALTLTLDQPENNIAAVPPEVVPNVTQLRLNLINRKTDWSPRAIVNLTQLRRLEIQYLGTWEALGMGQTWLPGLAFLEEMTYLSQLHLTANPHEATLLAPSFKVFVRLLNPYLLTLARGSKVLLLNCASSSWN